MKVLFVVNPAAGHGRGARRWNEVSAIAGSIHEDAAVWLTSGPGDAARLSRKGLEEGFEAIVAVGGDGTLGEVADGYLSAPESLRSGAVLGTWPVGSGCDFARALGIKAKARSFLQIFRQPKIERLDAGCVEFEGPSGPSRRYFLNVAALGLAGDVALKVSSKGKPWGGTLSYMMSSLGALACADPKLLELVVDGVPETAKPYHLIVLANTSTFGGGMRVAPHADPKDGFLDFVSVGELSRWGLLKRFPSIYTGGHIGTSGIAHRRLRCLEVNSPQKVYLNIDGEAIGTLPAIFKILPACVPFLSNA